MNKVYLEGTAPMDSKTTYHDDGKVYSSFVVVTNDHWKDKRTGLPVSRSTYHNCYCTGRVAELVDDLVKTGRAVFVEGSIEISEGANKQIFTTIRASYVKAFEKIIREPVASGIENERLEQIRFARTQADD